jgi:5'-nucleotidase
MNILVTNDDGIHAPALLALRSELAPLGRVTTVVPDRDQSATSHSLTLHRPLRIHRHGDDRYSVDGTPTDCVLIAYYGLLDHRPDLVISGINHGPNMGEDVFYSGTVGGAREGTFFGVPSIAVSLAVREAREMDFSAAAAFAARLAGIVLAKGLPERTLLNVNVPPGVPSGVAVTVQGRREHEGTIFEGLDPRRRTYYWIEEGTDRWLSDEMSDIHAVRGGLISVSPLQTDTTHHAVVSAFRGWLPALGATGGEADARRAGGEARRAESKAPPADTEGPRGEAAALGDPPSRVIK